MKKRKIAIYLVMLSVVVIVAFWVTLSAINEPKNHSAPDYSITGVVNVPAFELPPSPYMSTKAKTILRARALLPGDPGFQEGGIDDIRRSMEERVARLVKAMQSRYAVDIEEREIAGIRTRIVTPSDSVVDGDRVLINLHGGAFAMCADGCALLESVPVAALGKFPPTLLITGTRAMDMSPAIYTHSQLLKAGVKSQLIVGEAMPHCYLYMSDFPEARDAYQLIVRFFRENLG